MKVHVFVVGPLSNNSFLLADEDTRKAAVVDPGMGSESILEYIARKQYQIEWILNTHAHFDHVAGNALIAKETGAPIAMHPDDKPILEKMPEMMAMFGFEPIEPSEPQRCLKDNDTVEIGKTVLQVVKTPGHSPGHVIFTHADFAVVGDLVFAGSIGRTDLPLGNYQAMIDSIRRHFLTLRDDTLVYCGHGPSTTVGEERRINPFLRDLL